MRKTMSLMLMTSLLALAPASFAGEQIYKVELNKTEIVRLPGIAGSIIVGNPKIADVTVQSANTIFVVGRGYGETNLIVLDTNGQTMMDTSLQVVNTLSPHSVRLYNAKSRETYSCIPYCGPSPVLGDDPAFIGENTANDRPLDATLAAGISTPGGSVAEPEGGAETVGESTFQPAPQRPF